MKGDMANIIFSFILLGCFSVMSYMCMMSELESGPQPILGVYEEDGVTLSYIRYMGVEYQVVPTPKMDLLLDTLETKTKQLALREEQIASYQKISARQKADVEMCRSERERAYDQLDLCLKKDIPIYQTNEFSFLAGYTACAASFAVWKAVDKN